MATLHRSIVVLGKITTVPLLIALARAVVQAMTTNKSTFPTPNPPLPQVTTDANALDTAQLATKSKTKGTVATRDEARTVLVADLHQLQAYVQQIADASPEHAAVIIQSAGMSVRKTAPRNKSDLVVKASKVSGSMDVVAKAGQKRASHEWQISPDGKTWTNAPPTLQANTTIPNLTPGAIMYVRHREVTKSGPGDWSQVVSAVVV